MQLPFALAMTVLTLDCFFWTNANDFLSSYLFCIHECEEHLGKTC